MTMTATKRALMSSERPLAAVATGTGDGPAAPSGSGGRLKLTSTTYIPLHRCTLVGEDVGHDRPRHWPAQPAPGDRELRRRWRLGPGGAPVRAGAHRRAAGARARSGLASG